MAIAIRERPLPDTAGRAIPSDQEYFVRRVAAIGDAARSLLPDLVRLIANYIPPHSREVISLEVAWAFDRPDLSDPHRLLNASSRGGSVFADPDIERELAVEKYEDSNPIALKQFRKDLSIPIRLFRQMTDSPIVWNGNATFPAKQISPQAESRTELLICFKSADIRAVPLNHPDTKSSFNLLVLSRELSGKYSVLEVNFCDNRCVLVKRLAEIALENLRESSLWFKPPFPGLAREVHPYSPDLPADAAAAAKK